MKTHIIVFLGSIVILGSGCYTSSYTQSHAKNYKGIREWKSGKPMSHNRRPNERPQCIDSW